MGNFGILPYHGFKPGILLDVMAASATRGDMRALHLKGKSLGRNSKFIKVATNNIAWNNRIVERGADDGAQAGFFVHDMYSVLVEKME